MFCSGDSAADALRRGFIGSSTSGEVRRRAGSLRRIRRL